MSIGGDNMVDNYGIVTGNVVLIGLLDAASSTTTPARCSTPRTSSMPNESSTTARSRRAGAATIRTTGLSNDLTQGASGVYAVDLDPATATSDQLVVFDDAQLAGNVAVQLLSLPLSPIETYTILTTPAAASPPPVSGSLPARRCTPRS